ncbi:helix-turn-helix transcriptional regulator [Streptomyces sp. SCL15-4]|uniref:helix-turn-helix transcriptional regulator n=1 Tax=Streptomyces sp. SCL15-4 TaxID=2967221 RepID=UPI0029662C31|nr:helix-turn-helix transcriptional regulator [Streptomyces sp. SCL15-4]
MRDLPTDDGWIIDRRRHIGGRIRAERLRQSLTQDEVYLAAGISRWTLQRVEAGEDVQLSTLLRIACVLDIPLRDLVG